MHYYASYSFVLTQCRLLSGQKVKALIPLAKNYVILHPAQLTRFAQT
mgnify:CR=1 FL=1